MTQNKKHKFKKSGLISIRSYLLMIVFVIIGFSSLFPDVSGEVEIGVKNKSTLQDYLIYAAKNSPGLKAAFNMWKAELEKVAQVKSLPDPKFNFAYFVKEVETKVGPQQFKVGLMQKIPWFGKLKLKGEKALKKAEALQQNFERKKLALFLKIKNIFYDYYYISKSIKIIRENISLIEAVEKQISSMYSTGRASYSNIIRIQVAIDKLKDRKKSLIDRLPSLRVALNAAMNRPIGKEIYVENKINDLILHLNSSELIRILKKNSPDLKVLDNLIESAEAGVKLSRKNYFPDITLGLDLINTGDSLMSDVVDNGKNPFLIKMSINLPIRFKKIKAAIRESRLRLETSQYVRKEKENRLVSALESALFNFNDSGRVFKLYRDSLIPKAEQAFEVTRTAFSTGKSKFIDFIDTQRTLLEFELLLEKAKSSHYKNLALIEKIIGKNLNK